MRSNIDEAMRRTRAYWYEDGLTEIAVGCIFALIGLLFITEALLPQGVARGSLAALGLPVVVIGGWLVASKLVRLAKERITYPRTGYVSYGRPPRRVRPATIFFGFVIGVTLAVLLALYPVSLSLIPAFEGLLIGAFLLYFGYRVDVLRFVALAVVSAVVGVAATLASLDDPLGMAAYFGVTGLAAVISGVAALASYLRHSQPPAEGNQGGAGQ